jgi:hypothetical protein
MVLSFMVAGPFSLVWSSFGTTGPPHRSHRSWHGPCGLSGPLLREVSSAGTIRIANAPHIHEPH